MGTPLRLFEDSAPRPQDRPPGARGNLPLPLDAFVGRDAELRLLSGLVERARLVTLTGPAGVGKSRLAQHAATAAQDRFTGGVWRLDVSHTATAPQLRSRLRDFTASGTGTAPQSPASLLVLDGCERLDAECTALLVRLLEHSGTVRILATSRRPLDAPGEYVCMVPPLPEDEAVSLLAERAAGVPSDEADAAPPGVLADVCRDLDGLPLAIELAAHRLRALSPGQLHERLTDRFDVLECGTRAGPEHHRSLRTAVGLSHQLCSPQERLLWARLSVFAGEFDLEAAEYLCSDEDLPSRRVLDTLDGLVAQSVVVRSPGLGTRGQARYHLLETVRAYGAEWLERLGEGDLRRRRHRDWYVGVAARSELDWFGPRQQETVTRAAHELRNLRAALECGTGEPEDADLAQFLAGALWFLWIGCGRQREGAHWLDRALAAPGTRAAVRAKALWVRALLALAQGEGDAAERFLDECRCLARQSGHGATIAHAAHGLGCLRLAQGDPHAAEAALAEAMDRYRRLGEFDTWVILTQVELAQAHAAHGEWETARGLAQEAAEVAGDSHDHWAWACAQHTLGYVHLVRGDAPRALRAVLGSAAVKLRFGDLPGMAVAAEFLSALACDEEPQHAAELLGAADAGWDAVGARHFGSAHCAHLGQTCRTRLVTALGPEEFEAARARGVRLGLSATLAHEVERAGTVPSPEQPQAGIAPERPRPAAGAAAERDSTATGRGTAPG
ncbi:ATP-binding protein [Streptomyces sulphureus]|uniref:ATP-binding protein n=1 Tax=Streptomyces sulphureus TaxID=47758 RepID=UPI00035ED95B|nr:AAA family ATPase [Streptomyces sulphureus]